MPRIPRRKSVSTNAHVFSAANAGVLAFALSFAIPNAANAQCTLEWTSHSGVPGFSDEVRVIKNWDPDGLGPLAPVTLFAGAFEVAGSVRANKIAAWDGTQFTSFADGLGDHSSEYIADVIEYQGDLYVAGSFFGTDDNPLTRIARWDGAAWRPLGSGVGYSRVNAMEVFDNKLIVGGDFGIAGGNTACNEIGAWNGQSWSAMANGLYGEVYDLAVYQNELYAAGYLILQDAGVWRNIAKWNGASWQPVGTGLSGSCYKLHVHDGRLIATGRFTTAGSLAASHVAAFDGTNWSRLGNGVDILPRAMTTHEGEIWVAGRDESSSSTTWKLYRWDGADWQGFVTDMSQYEPIYALAALNGQLFVGGDFRDVNGLVTHRIATFDAPNWRRPFDGSSISIYDSVVFDGNLVVGGIINLIDGAPFNNIAMRENDQWQALGAGLDGIVYAVALHEGELFAGGAFTSSDQTALSNIARWDGQQWRPLGTGVNGTVRELVTCGGNLIAQGYFTDAGGIPANGVARWDGLNWSQIPALPEEDAYVDGIGCFHDDLVVVGELFSVVGDYLSEIAVFDGTQWVRYGTDDIYGAGGFTEFEGRLHAMIVRNEADVYFARWNGAEWESVGGEHRLEGGAFIPVYNRLVVAGYFRDSPGYNGATIVSIKDDVWNLVSEERPSNGYVLQHLQGDLVIMGNFNSTPDNVAISYSSLTPACARGDFDCDGVVTTLDIIPFANALVEHANSTVCELLQADMNQDDQLNSRDLEIFIDQLLAG